MQDQGESRQPFLDGRQPFQVQPLLSREFVLGINKVNIGTDGRLLWTRVHREFFLQSPKEFDFMAPGRIYMEAYAAFVAAKCEQLGAAGRARQCE